MHEAHLVPAARLGVELFVAGDEQLPEDEKYAPASGTSSGQLVILSWF